MLVVVFAYHGVQLLDIAGPVDVLAEGGLLAGDARSYRFQLVSPDGAAVHASNGMRIEVDSALQDVFGEIDTILVPGGSEKQIPDEVDAIVRWLSVHSHGARRVAAICTGSFLLGSAGLLDGKRVTTHWKKAKQFASRFPKAAVEPDRIVLRDGQLYTSGGKTGGMDLALGLVEEDYGKDVALNVARQLVLLPKRDRGQAQFRELRPSARREGCIVEGVKHWLCENLGKPLSPEQLSLESGMSLANFREMFVRATGMEPEKYIEIVRVEAAQRMLETSNAPLRRVAEACGFSGTSELRRQFINHVGVPPSLYRREYGSPSKH
ncbi:GlxA family transcriptional regulator [Noviherbaspirillum sp.]|uniref:GlxA family transcriptional regulator n=1 Tax=Noviherbaspirillum sp. TaxID=1926288 RepID=UPI002D3DE2A3|nr:GlxA family transcriptional regulator [Noviherbaspirillum sp.]HZW19738.1 GlxA family transcriptional regulator [Noviherbaspirillum sp.]